MDSARGESHYPAFVGNWPTIIHTFLALVVTRNSIFSRKNVIWRLGRGCGEGLRGKQFITFSVSVRQKKTGVFLHIDLLYYQGNKARIHTVCCCTINHACSFNRKRLEQIFALPTECLFNFYCYDTHNWKIYNHLSNMCVLNILTKSIIYMCPARNHCIAVLQ